MVGGENPRLRFGTLALVCVGLFAALFARLWYLQVMNAPAYRQVAVLNSTRTLVIPAPRGRILDRNGNVLVDNRPTKVVAIDRQALAKATDRDAVLSRLATLLNRYQSPSKPYTLTSIKHTLNFNRVGPFDPVPLAQNVDDKLLIELTEHSSDFPGVVAETSLLRQYHYGSLAAQVLGRVGPISPAMYAARLHTSGPYQNDAQVGVAGVEQSFEKQLRGVDGKRVVEVTPSGNIVRAVKTIPPTPGDDVELTIDINAQAVAEDSLNAQVIATRRTDGSPPVPGAAALLMQPKTGQILAMASYPSFDPSIFVPSISDADWQALAAPSANTPMLNRADGGLFSPGSTFKLATAIAGLRAGIITPSSTYQDNGVIQIDGCTGGGCTLSNDSGDGALGPISLPRALTKSSNVYFFNIGQRLWEGRGTFGVNALQDTAGDLGFGKLSGLDLPDEKAVPLPSRARNIMLHKIDPKNYPNMDANGNWYTGTNMNVAIGQGDVLVTPVQLANAYAQFGNGGDRFRPTLLYRVLKPFTSAPGQPVPASDVVSQPAPVKSGHIDIPQAWHDAMLQGFSGVTQTGTAGAQFQGFPMSEFPVAGKTGTAQTGYDQATGRANFSDALFVGFGPAPDPNYVGVAMLEKAGYGADAAAPVVRDMLQPIATGGTWPTVAPTIPSTPPPITTTTTPTSSTVPGDTTLPGQTGPGTSSDSAPGSGQAVTNPQSDTTETTTTGPVAQGGR